MRPPVHVVASYAWQAWVYSRGGSEIPFARFETYTIWEVESGRPAAARQTLAGCSACRRDRNWIRHRPPDLDWWQDDLAELSHLLRTRIIPVIANIPKPVNDRYRQFHCGFDIRCGTVRGYNHGGRCKWCRKIRQHSRAAQKVMICGTDPRCGTNAGRMSGGTCRKCKDAANAYQRWRWANGKLTFECGTDPRCGTVNGYRAGGRCEKCTWSTRILQREKRRKKRAAAG